MKYDAWKFIALAESDLGKALWDFLNQYDNLIRLETATILRRPGVEGVAKLLKNRFGKEFKELNRSEFIRVKQMIGHMVKQIMEKQGYEVYRKNVKVITDELFSKATRYIKKVTDKEIT